MEIGDTPIGLLATDENMKPVVTATFLLSNAIIKGLENGDYVRWEGVIREAATGRIVTFLREVGSTTFEQ